MTENQDKMPKTEIEDIVDKAMRVVAKSVPIVGPGLELIISFAEAPIEIRKREWFESIAKRLSELEREVKSFGKNLFLIVL